jgi:hypothetical protein
MKTLLLSAFIFICTSCLSQQNSFDSFKQDTLTMPTPIDFKKCVLLELDSALVYIDFDFFKSKLSLERKGCYKRIKERKNLMNDRIVANQSAVYKKQYVVLDSIYDYLRRDKKSDTFYVRYNVFSKVNSPFGDFIPGLIENGQCIVADKNKTRQSFLIRQIGWKKNGSFSSGSRLFFIPGHSKHFWSKWDWST